MLLDIGVGILLAILTGEIFQVEVGASLVLLGILFSLLPDIDFFLELFKHGSVGGKVIREHRQTPFHYPLFYIPAILIIYFTWGASLAFLFGATILAHFLHDSVGIGWGLRWLAPFSQGWYKFFSTKEGRISFNPLVSWETEELKQFKAQYGDPNWIRNIYLRPHPISIIELAIFVIAAVVLFRYFGS